MPNPAAARAELPAKEKNDIPPTVEQLFLVFKRICLNPDRPLGRYLHPSIRQIRAIRIGTQKLTKDYPELIKSRFVLEAVINELSLPFTYEGLNGMVSVSAPADTRVISITVTDADPVRAMDIANEVRETAAVHIGNVMETEAVNVVETANLPTYKSSPSIGKNTVMGGMAGVLIVAAVTIILYLTNDTVKTAEDVERYLGLSTLAVIPMNEGSGKKRRKKNGRKR